MSVKMTHVTKKFGKLLALNDVTATFDRGHVIALIGPNGSGKSTLIKCILGMVRNFSGEITINDTSIHRQVDYRKDIGYMPQIGRYPANMRIRQVIQMLKDIRQADENVLDRELADLFHIHSIEDKMMHSLSGGTTQKVSATLAFMFNSPILILDEPTAGLDPIASEMVKHKILKEKCKGKLILITSHVLNELDDITTDVLFLNEGRMEFYDSFQNIKNKTHEDTLSKAMARIMASGYQTNVS